MSSWFSTSSPSLVASGSSGARPPRFDSLPQPSAFPTASLATSVSTSFERARPTHKVAPSCSSSIASSASSCRSGVSSSRSTSTAWSSILDSECEYGYNDEYYNDAEEEEEDEEDLDALYTSYEQHYQRSSGNNRRSKASPAPSIMFPASSAVGPLSASPDCGTDAEASATNDAKEGRGAAAATRGGEECRSFAASDPDHPHHHYQHSRADASPSSSSELASTPTDHHATTAMTTTTLATAITSPEDLLEQLARLGSAMDACFCGRPAEADSIYCGRECSRADAMRALCGGHEETAATANQVASTSATPLVSSPSSSSLQRLGSGEGVSHYRRRVERKRAEERASQEDAGSHWRSQLATRSGSASPSSSRHPSVSSIASLSSSSATSLRSEKRRLPARTSASSAHSKVPSLSSSLTSSASSTFCSPRIPSYPNHQGDSHDAQRPKIVFPSPTRRAHGLTSGRTLSSDVDDDLFSAYLDATPTLASVHAQRMRVSDEEYGVPSREQQPLPMPPGSGLGSVGLMMLQCEDGDEEDEMVAGLGQGLQWQERVRAQMVPRPGHTRGKLSFDDVLSVLGS